MGHGDPRGFVSVTTHAGIKDDAPDLVCVASETACAADGVFTRSRFAGPSVAISRAHVADGRARAVVTLSKNANVATGAAGEADARRVVEIVAEQLGVDETDVLIASTGVIGVPYPMERIVPALQKLRNAMGPADFEAAATGIMTTDTRPKVRRGEVGAARITGIAKGVGMIEPRMATLLAYFFTDAQLAPRELSRAFRGAVGRTFNRMSVDTDTSTSDTALILANGLAGPVDPADFASELERVARELVFDILGDGEGATKLIEVCVERARDEQQALVVGKAIVNSPLVKTAVHGADPNWGRVAMAIGKCEEYEDISPETTEIRMADVEVFPRPASEETLARIRKALEGDSVRIGVRLNAGSASATVWGCDLSPEYVRLNSEYTT